MTDREEFEAWMKSLSGYPFAGQFANLMWAAWQAARATAEQSAPYGYVYEWDCSPGVVHRDFGYGTYNGRYPDRTVTVYAALKSQQDAAIESKPAESSADTERLDFVESASTTWYPGRAPNGYGVLCYDIKGRHRAETFGKTMREAIAAAIESQRSGDGS